MAGVYYYDGQWFDEQPKLTGPMDPFFLDGLDGV